MSEVNREQIETCLKSVVDVNLGKDLITGNVVRDIRIDGGKVELSTWLSC